MPFAAAIHAAERRRASRFWVSWFGLERRRFCSLAGVVVALAAVISTCVADPPMPGSTFGGVDSCR